MCVCVCTEFSDWPDPIVTTKKITKISFFSVIIILLTNFKLYFEVSLNSFRDYPFQATLCSPPDWRTYMHIWNRSLLKFCFENEKFSHNR